MSGLRILYVQPRLIGSAKDWSGLDAHDKKSWLIEHARSMNFNAIWFSPLFSSSSKPVIRHGKTVSGSLYATRDHFTLDNDFSAAPGEQDISVRHATDDTHIRHFTSEARKSGVRVIADMVFNHVACDHPEVESEDTKIDSIRKFGTNLRPVFMHGSMVGMKYDLSGARDQTFLFKFQRDRNFDLITPGTQEEAWDDVAKINYNSPAALDFFVRGTNGNPGYWKAVIDWHIERGFTDFRCDVAYMIPPHIWSELIQHAHDKLPGVTFMAETLGDNGQADALQNATITVNGQKRLAFDLAMLPTYWWDFKDPWLVQENIRLQKIARYGGAGFPDNHDTPNTVAGHFFKLFSGMQDTNRRDEAIADICARNYAVAALLSSSVYMQMGYEYCREQVSVFRNKDARKYWLDLIAKRAGTDTPLDISERIRTVNDFKERLHNANAIVQIDNIQQVGNSGRLLRIECALRHHETGADLGSIDIYVNERAEEGPINITDSDLKDRDTGMPLHRVVLEPEDTKTSSKREIRDVAAFYTCFEQPPAPVAPPRKKPSSPGISPN